MKRIIDHLTEKYTPSALILYGSYASGTNGPGSDFDALLVREDGENLHDTAIFRGTPLDVFVYSKDYLDRLEDLNEILPIFDGRVILDQNGYAQALKEKVLARIAAQPKLSDGEKESLRAWCRKMMNRCQRGDAEGLYRWHWLLTDSLDIYCGLRDQFYFGPKKTLARMAHSDPEGYGLYLSALKDIKALAPWIEYLKKGL